MRRSGALALTDVRCAYNSRGTGELVVDKLGEGELVQVGNCAIAGLEGETSPGRHPGRNRDLAHGQSPGVKAGGAQRACLPNSKAWMRAMTSDNEHADGPTGQITYDTDDVGCLHKIARGCATWRPPAWPQM